MRFGRIQIVSPRKRIPANVLVEGFCAGTVWREDRPFEASDLGSAIPLALCSFSALARSYTSLHAKTRRLFFHRGPVR